MLFTSQNSIVRSYDHSEGKLTEAKGLVQIRAFFTAAFATQMESKLGMAPVTEITEDPRQVFRVWDEPDAGVMGASETLLFENERGNYKTIVQVRRLYKTQ